MNNPQISLIVAASDNNVIGNKGKIPWHLPTDLKRFRAKTTRHVMIMGRKTWDSFGNKPLPNRSHIIVTHEQNYQANGAIITHSIDEALGKAKEILRLTLNINQDEIFVIGGGELFKAAMPLADKLYLTLVHKNVEGDAFMPDYSAFTKVVFKDDLEENGIKYSFLDLER